jgi:hypothetical protein
VLAVGFLSVTAVWLVPVGGRLGVGGIARDVLLLGSGAADLCYLAHPPPQFHALAVTAAALGLALPVLAVTMYLQRGRAPIALLPGARQDAHHERLA